MGFTWVYTASPSGVVNDDLTDEIYTNLSSLLVDSILTDDHALTEIDPGDIVVGENPLAKSLLDIYDEVENAYALNYCRSHLLNDYTNHENEYNATYCTTDRVGYQVVHDSTLHTLHYNTDDSDKDTSKLLNENTSELLTHNENEKADYCSVENITYLSGENKTNQVTELTDQNTLVLSTHNATDLLAHDSVKNYQKDTNVYGAQYNSHRDSECSAFYGDDNEIDWTSAYNQHGENPDHCITLCPTDDFLYNSDQFSQYDGDDVHKCKYDCIWDRMGQYDNVEDKNWKTVNENNTLF